MGRARRRITVADDAETLVHWRAGRPIRQIARSLGYARNTIRERIAQATARLMWSPRAVPAMSRVREVR